MTDTRRTAAELESLLADNVTGDITPQIMRDFLKSVKSHHAVFSWDISNPQVTAINAIDTYVKLAGGITNPGYISNDVLHVDPLVPNRIVYSDVNIPNQHVEVTYSVSFKTGNNQTFHFAPAVNGVVLEEWEQAIISAGANDPTSVTITAHLILNAGDYVELWAANITGTTDVTIVSGSADMNTKFE